jgi:hypothetical protein
MKLIHTINITMYWKKLEITHIATLNEDIHCY